MKTKLSVPKIKKWRTYFLFSLKEYIFVFMKKAKVSSFESFFFFLHENESKSFCAVKKMVIVCIVSFMT